MESILIKYSVGKNKMRLVSKNNKKTNNTPETNKNPQLKLVIHNAGL